MKTMSSLLKGSPLSTLRNQNSQGQTQRMGDPVEVADAGQMVAMRQQSQMNASIQVQNYAAAKEMAAQGRNDMRGNVTSYSDTMG